MDEILKKLDEIGLTSKHRMEYIDNFISIRRYTIDDGVQLCGRTWMMVHDDNNIMTESQFTRLCKGICNLKDNGVRFTSKKEVKVLSFGGRNVKSFFKLLKTFFDCKKKCLKIIL